MALVAGWRRGLFGTRRNAVRSELREIGYANEMDTFGSFEPRGRTPK
ncbi:MAG: hypothetical protein H6Q86_4163 [candidate division NC10 bacterium]|jgi:hypothetical protein|nr:hypothetical protein [candidate division NC10 bacterium]